MEKIGNDWDYILEDAFLSNEYKNLEAFLNDEYLHKTVYPSRDNIFKALKLSSYANTKVVIIGQDPYHEPNQAHGLAFSVCADVKLPPSLRNIFKEIQAELKITPAPSGDLTRWAKQGVLLLNNVLTVRAGEANSHKNKGWEFFTDEIIRRLNLREESVIFVFWGNFAKRKKALITEKRHYILESCHPSPLSAYHGFFGCGHFLKINEILLSLGKKEIDWH